MTLFLVRHGRPLVDRTRAAAEWELDPAAYDDVWALRDRLPAGASWYASPEPKAVQTAQLLTDDAVGVVEGLREHRRPATWVDDFDAAVARAFERPGEPAHEGWETIDACRDRVVTAVRAIRVQHSHDQRDSADRDSADIVLVGHGTAWTLVVAELTGAAPDLDSWRTMLMPDLLVVRQ